MFSIVNIIKALACLLIANFHSDITFPDKLSILAFGGDLGNNFFFLISGFTIWPSVCRTVRGGEFDWYKRRFFRIIPMVSVFYIAELAMGNVSIRSLGDAIHAFVFPTLYWFTGAIVVMYAAFYVVEKMTSKTARGWIAALLVMAHIVFDGIAAERYLIGFLAMMVGSELRREMDTIIRKTDRTNHLIVWCGVSMVAYCILKLLRTKEIEFLGLIHLSIGLLTILIGALLLIWGLRSELLLAKLLPRHGTLWKLILALSDITMAVYLTMGLADRFLMKAFIRILPFPLSYIINLCVSLAVAYGITKIEQQLRKRVGQG